MNTSYLTVIVTAVFIITLLVPACTRQAPPGPTCINPIIGQGMGGGADPAVILYGETYYYYGTTGKVMVHISRDLVHWQMGPQVLPDTLRGSWAPEVYYHPEDNKLYMYYTFKYKIGVAVGTRPDSMFTDLGFLAIPGIDAHLFRDDDGRLYLYFTHTPPFSMYCVPLKSPTETGGPVTKCFEISQEWEKHSFPINEGPWMEKRNGKYTLLYSGSNGQSRYYAVGAAFAPTPLGPFTKYDKNPVFQDLDHIHGPGHGSITRDRAGQLWHLYHQKTDTAIGWARDICLDPMTYDEAGILRGTPTRGTAQPAPACDPDLVWSPDFHPRGAVFNDRVEVSITSRTTGADVRYTLDGSEPTEKSARFVGPFSLSQTTTVRARAFKKGMQSSAVATELYTRTDGQLPENLAPNAAPGDFPFDVFTGPVKNWKEHLKKGINTKKNR